MRGHATAQYCTGAYGLMSGHRVAWGRAGGRDFDMSAARVTDMRRRQALGVIGGSISLGLAGCLASGNADTNTSDTTAGSEVTDPYADLDVVEELTANGWYFSIDYISDHTDVSVYDNTTEEVVSVDPEKDRFVGVSLTIEAVVDEPKEIDIETLNNIPILVDGEPYTPIDELPDGYGFDDQVGDNSLLQSEARDGLDPHLLILAYDAPNGDTVVDTRVLDGVDAVLREGG